MKFGLIGTGFIVEEFIKACNMLKGIEVVSLFTRNKVSEQAQMMKETYNISKIYDDFDKFINDKDINFIYVASPNNLHYKQSLAALNAGKNVVCEKPFTPTKKEAKELFSLAKKKQLMIFEAIITIHLPNYQIIKNNIDKLGNIKIAQLNFSQYSSKYDSFLKGETPNVFNTSFSGGSLQDINIYNIHFIINMFGLPKEASYYPNIKRGIDTSGIVMMRYDNFNASLVGAKDSKSDCFVYIQGEKGFMKIDSSASTCTNIQLNLNESNTNIMLNLQTIENGIYYEMKQFKNIYNNKDFDKAEELAQYSLNIVGFTEEIRKKANIIFSSDNA